MRFGVYGRRGVAFLQVWLMVFGFVAVVGMMGGVLGRLGYAGENDIPATDSLTDNKKDNGIMTGLMSFWEYPFGIGKKGAEGFKVVGGTGHALVDGFKWAAIAYYAGTMIGDMFGMSEKNSKALGTALAAGTFAYNALDTFEFAANSPFATEGAFSWGGLSPGMVGVGIGIVVFALMYKEVETKVVEFNCMPWQAPVGGDSCEVCNDADLPCSEYRCRALGQNCEIVNAGTEEEKCVNVNPRDVSPPVIRPNYNELSVGHDYKNVRNSPPGPGFDIVRVGAPDGCLEVFTPLEFGLILDEPGQCKIDASHTTKFDDMVAYVGGSNLYLYNHSERFSLPSAAAIENSSLVLENGKDMTFFVRCRDKNGNENGAEYAVNFCVDPTPDSTAPRIEATSVENGGCVAENIDSSEVKFYTNEPAQCRWSSVDQAYENMVNEMSCSNEVYQANAAQLFTCVAELGGIARDGTSYYVRCEDRAEDKNVMRQSFVFSLRGSTGLVLKNLQPNGTVSGSVSPMPVELYAETLFGCNNGRAVCEWSSDPVGYQGSNGAGGSNFIQFFDTNTEDGIHTQRLDLGSGAHKYFVKCIDAGGNLVESSVEFNLDIDNNPPMIARIYEEGEMLKIVTVRDSECSYTFDNCDFSFEEGTEMPYGNTTVHVAEWNEDKTYYIKCRDEFLNVEAGCSVIVRPTSNFL